MITVIITISISTSIGIDVFCLLVIKSVREECRSLVACAQRLMNPVNQSGDDDYNACVRYTVTRAGINTDDAQVCTGRRARVSSS